MVILYNHGSVIHLVFLPLLWKFLQGALDYKMASWIDFIHVEYKCFVVSILLCALSKWFYSYTNNITKLLSDTSSQPWFDNRKLGSIYWQLCLANRVHTPKQWTCDGKRWPSCLHQLLNPTHRQKLPFGYRRPIISISHSLQGKLKLKPNFESPYHIPSLRCEEPIIAIHTDIIIGVLLFCQ